MMGTLPGVSSTLLTCMDVGDEEGLTVKVPSASLLIRALTRVSASMRVMSVFMFSITLLYLAPSGVLGVLILCNVSTSTSGLI